MIKKLLLSFFILLNLTLFSQIDTAFWFATPEVSAPAGDSPIYLRFMTYSAPVNNITVSLWNCNIILDTELSHAVHL